MATCVVCNKELSLFETMKNVGKIKCCSQCNTRLLQAQKYWLDSLERAFAEGGVSQQMEQALLQNFRELRMIEELAQPVFQRLQYLRNLSEILWGNIPIIRVDIHMDSDEMAHFLLQATYFKPNKQVRPVPGRLIGTNKKLYFLSSVGRDSMTLDWNNVIKVDMIAFDQRVQSPTIFLQVSKGSGGGFYSVPDSLYAKVMIDTLVRLWKRQLVIYKEQAAYGAIPQHVKNAVFQRDGGRCVQCGYQGEYIEYDHIIPRSKGGPNTVENIQLLCRKCNLRKGDRL